MTAYEIFVPAFALAIAGCGVLWLRWEGRQLDRRLADERDRRSKPAE